MKALIFDLGNVVFECSFDYAKAVWARLSGESYGAVDRRLNLDHPVHEKFERGEIDEYEFRQFVSNQLRYPLSSTDFREGWNSIYGSVINGVPELLNDLGANFRLIALTNTNSTHEVVWKRKYGGELMYFEKVFSSNRIGFRKPEPEPYMLCLEYLGLSASQALFLDDRAENTAAASRLGITSITVRSFDQMRHDLSKYI